MSKILTEVLKANEGYVSSFDKGHLALPPARGFAILTCMDARLDPAKYAGLSEGDAHVIMGDLLSKSLDTATVDEKGWHDVGKGPGSTDGKYINWLTFKNNELSVLEDVNRIRNHSLVPNYIPIYGFIYDVKTGKLIEVPEAMKAGRPA